MKQKLDLMSRIAPHQLDVQSVHAISPFCWWFDLVAESAGGHFEWVWAGGGGRWYLTARIPLAGVTVIGRLWSWMRVLFHLHVFDRLLVLDPTTRIRSCWGGESGIATTRVLSFGVSNQQALGWVGKIYTTRANLIRKYYPCSLSTTPTWMHK